jgi:monoamine oxidase
VGGLTRHGLLGAGAALAAGLTIAPRAGAARASGRVAVIGAGLAGLTCAHRLVAAGLSVDVVEARERIGGRAWTEAGPVPGQVSENGGELVDSGHRAIRALCRELGVGLVDLEAVGSDDAAPRALLRGRLSGLDAAFAGLGAVEAAAARDLARPRALDRLDAGTWIDRASPSPRLRAALRALVEGEYGAAPEQMSALVLARDLDADDPGADERFRIRGGTRTLVDALVARVGSGRIATGIALAGIRRTAAGRPVVALASPGPAARRTYDRVVLALPFTTLRRADLRGAGLSAAKLRAIRELGMGTNAKVILPFRRRAWIDDGWDGEALSDTALGWTWDGSLGQPGRGGFLVSFTGGRAGALTPGPDHGPAPARLVRDRLRVIGEVADGVAAAAAPGARVNVWTRDPWSLGSYSFLAVGQATTIAAACAPPEGPWHFCGEHTAGRFRGYMEGAVASGERAAREVLAALARP